MYNKSILIVIFALLALFAQSQKKVKDTIQEKLARQAFEGSYIINNPTNVVFPNKTLEIQIMHRFGLINSENNDLAGIWGPANIRLGATYAVSNRVTLGFGTTKFNRLQDFSIKAALLRQTKSAKTPISVTYFGNFTVNADKKELFEFDQDRFSFFNQLIITRRVGPNLSLQFAPSLSHFNFVEFNRPNDVFAIAFGGRLKLSPQSSLLIDFNQPFNQMGGGASSSKEPFAGLAIGFEFATTGHAFQFFVGNYNGIVPQQNHVFNQNDFFAGDILIGFNITRAYRF